MASFAEQVNRTPLTYIVLVAYVALAIVTGSGHPEEEYRRLIAYGACEGELVQRGEPWRLLTYAFLHGGLLHLLFNAYSLLIIGPALEHVLGGRRFALLYVISALGGSIAGCLWHEYWRLLVGGSGALFGMMGAALALNMRQGRHLLDFLNYVGPRQIVVLIIANLVLGIVIPVVSNAGHIGGLIAGFALAFCFLERGRAPVDRTSRAIQAGWIALFASLVFYCVRPVVRSDYLLDRYQRAAEAGALDELAEYRRALFLAMRE